MKAGRWLRVPYGVLRSLLREISEDEIRNAPLTGRVASYDRGRDRFVVIDRIPERGEISVVAEFGTMRLVIRSASRSSRRISQKSDSASRHRPWYSRLVCKHCGSSYEIRRRTLRLRWGLARFVFREVPVLTCIKCGDTFYFPQVLRKLENRMKAHLRRSDVAEFRYGS